MCSRIVTFSANWDREPHVGGCQLQGARNECGFNDSHLVKELYEQDKPDTEATQEVLEETVEKQYEVEWRDALRSKIPTCSVI